MHEPSDLETSEPSPAEELKFVAERSAGDDAEGFPQHLECVAVLTMKCGEPLMAVRKKLHDEIAIAFIPDEGFGVFQSKVERHFSKLGPNYVQDQRAIYLKPSSNATQSKYVQLTKENFDPLLRVRWKVARSMKVELKYEVFCYFVDLTTKKEKKKLSIKVFQQQQQQQQQQQHSQLVDSSIETIGAGASAGVTASPTASFMPFGSAGGPSGFPLIQNYADMAMDGSLTPVTGAVKSAVVARTGSTGCKHAGRLDSTPLGSSDRPRKVARSKHLTATADPLQFEASAEEPVFHTIPFRINGFVVPLEVDINALKRSLGLDLAPSDVPASGLDPTAHL